VTEIETTIWREAEKALHAALVQVVKELKRFCVPLLCPLNRLGFCELIALWSFRVRQIVFPGRNRCDAA
jgi:hypothetical protein